VGLPWWYQPALDLYGEQQLTVYVNKYLDANGNGTAVIIWDCHGGTNPQWSLRA
jgi:hypothetical protein